MNKKRILYLSFLLLFLFLTTSLFAQKNERSIDVLLIIDGSGSMNWPDRDPAGLRIQGAKLFIDLCEKGDRLGVLDFSTDAIVIFPLFQLTGFRDFEELKSRIEKIEAKGEFTDITLALQTGLKEMTRARPDAVKAVILLTDGEIDPDPSLDIFAPYNKDYHKEIAEAQRKKTPISEIKKKYRNIVAPISQEILREKVLPLYKEKNIPIFTVAFGKGADVSLLREIADTTATEIGIRNFYFIEKASYLQPVFSEIVEQLKKKREKLTENEIEFIGEEIIHKINIDDFVKEVNFKFIFGRKITPSEIQITLKDPAGDIISRSTKKEGIGHILEEGYELFNIFNPLPGTWEVKIAGEKDIKLDITISTWGRTELQILTEILKYEYFAGEPIPILASLKIEGKRVTTQEFLRNLNFWSLIKNPENKEEQIELFDDGQHSDRDAADGIYGNIFTNTNIAGDYIVKVFAEGITTGLRKFNFRRETEYRIRVIPEKVAVVPSTSSLVKEEKMKGERKHLLLSIRTLKSIFIPIAVALVVILAYIVLKKWKGRPSIMEKEGIEEEPLPYETELMAPIPIIIKIKDKQSDIFASKQIKHSSVGEKNLILRRSGDQLFIRSEEGTLELNNSVVAEEEKELRDGDILKIGELYFKTQFNLRENKVILLPIEKEKE